MSYRPISVANFVNMIIVTLLFWDASRSTFLTIRVLSILTILGLWIQGWRKMQRRERRATASARGLPRMTMNAFIGGLLWAVPIIAMFHNVSEAQRVVLTTVAAGMICGGALSLAPIWQAAFVYSLTIAIPTAISLFGIGDPIYLGLAALTISFATLVGRTVADRSDDFVKGFLANRNLREQGHVISLLLKEFEENVSDFLWQVDADGRLVHASSRMAAMNLLSCRSIWSR